MKAYKINVASAQVQTGEKNTEKGLFSVYWMVY